MRTHCSTCDSKPRIIYCANRLRTFISRSTQFPHDSIAEMVAILIIIIIIIIIIKICNAHISTLLGAQGAEVGFQSFARHTMTNFNTFSISYVILKRQNWQIDAFLYVSKHLLELFHMEKGSVRYVEMTSHLPTRSRRPENP